MERETNRLISCFRKWFVPDEPKKKVSPSEELNNYINEKLKQAAPDTDILWEGQDTHKEKLQVVPESFEQELSEDSYICYDSQWDEAAASWQDAMPCSMPDAEDTYSYTCTAASIEYQKKPKAAAEPSYPAFALKERESRSKAEEEIDRLIRQRDESFQQMLFREIDSRGMTDVECYQRAHMDRKTFSKIRADVQYKPKKTTAVSLAFALRMTVEEASELLKKAGYALSDSSIFDVIIQYYLEKRKYDLFEINETLYYYDQPLLGRR